MSRGGARQLLFNRLVSGRLFEERLDAVEFGGVEAGSSQQISGEEYRVRVPGLHRLLLKGEFRGKNTVRVREQDGELRFEATENPTKEEKEPAKV